MWPLFLFRDRRVGGWWERGWKREGRDGGRGEMAWTESVVLHCQTSGRLLSPVSHLRPLPHPYPLTPSPHPVCLCSLLLILHFLGVTLPTLDPPFLLSRITPASPSSSPLALPHPPLPSSEDPPSPPPSLYIPSSPPSVVRG